MNGLRAKSVRDERPYERTHATPKVSTTSWSRDQKRTKIILGVDDGDDIECTLSTVDEINSGTMVQQQISEAHWEKILPTVKNGNVIEFEIETHNEYVELNRTNVEI